MSGATTVQVLPYTTGSDPFSNGDLQIKALADRLEQLLPYRVRKNGATNRQSTVVPADDPDLFFPVVANKTYEFEFYLVFTTGSSTIDARVGLTFPAAAVVSWGVLALDPAAVASSIGNIQASALHTAGSGTAISVGVSSGSTSVLIKGTIKTGANAGNVKLQWCQNASTATDMTLSEGSQVKAEMYP